MRKPWQHFYQKTNKFMCECVYWKLSSAFNKNNASHDCATTRWGIATKVLVRKVETYSESESESEIANTGICACPNQRLHHPTCSPSVGAMEIACQLIGELSHFHTRRRGAGWIKLTVSERPIGECIVNYTWGLRRDLRIISIRIQGKPQT